MRPRNVPNVPLWRLVPLCAASYCVNQTRVTCVLYRIADRRRLPDTVPPVPCYAIGMEADEERSLCLAGKDFPAARRLFTDVVKFTVTPCTLADVAEDRLRVSL